MFWPRDSNYNAWYWAIRNDLLWKASGDEVFNSVAGENWKTVTVKKCQNVVSYDNHNLPIAPVCYNDGNFMIIAFQFLKQVFSIKLYIYIHTCEYTHLRNLFLHAHVYNVANLSFFKNIHTEYDFMFVVTTK